MSASLFLPAQSVEKTLIDIVDLLGRVFIDFLFIARRLFEVTSPCHFLLLLIIQGFFDCIGPIEFDHLFIADMEPNHIPSVILIALVY